MKAVLVLLAFLSGASAEEGWADLFNGKDLSNWINVNCAADTWSVKDGVIQCTGQPTGALRTPRQYENFILELEWRHLKPGGNAGVFIWASPEAAPGTPFLRSIEVQVLDNGYDAKGKNEWYTTHGDVFPIHGATMKPIHKGKGDRCFPIEERSKSSPEWNHYRIVCNDGRIRLHVNGKEVSGGDDCHWRKGYLGLESEGSPTEWRNIRIKELPSTGATKEQSAPEQKG
ncbi:MAG: 3-keto-disaccharide hydrolase [Verrucomicrobiales bacterium]